jgi:proteasome lid subunit RPN8/RPN11
VDLPRQYADAIVKHALEDDPNECCGVLAGKDGAVLKHYRMTNVEKSPYRYSMDGKELLKVLNEIDDNKWELIAFYHSHTHSPAYPSQTDVRLATWPEAYYLLVSLMDKAKPDIRTFHIVDGKITEEPVRITPA